MRVKSDINTWYKAMDRWHSMCKHQASKQLAKADAMYYDLYIKYFERLRTAIEEGKIVAHVTSVPTEIILLV